PQPQTERVGQLLGDGASYCDSAVLVAGWLSGFAGDGVGGDNRPLVFFPGDEVLLVCTDDPQVAPAFFDAAERVYRDADIPISPQAYTIVGERIVPCDAAGPGPVRPWAMRARSVLAATEYEAQAERLLRDHADRLTADVGSVQLIDTPAGVRTLTAWRQGSPWLLPRTDYVLVAGPDEQFVVPFGVLADVVGLIAGHELLPPRCAVTRWPSAEEMAALRAHAVSF
ncbi:MAG TPA: hypothetical protein VFW21_02495, partial [Mycobacterium sp.]|nr:hypothetical protein [Mycobacterium sp.]